jgi:hypothetical protein
MQRKRLPRAAGRTALALVSLTIGLTTVASASASQVTGQLIRNPRHVHLVTPHGVINANESSNWFGYNLGAVERGGEVFNSISGDWTVPTATQHSGGQAEDSADWIGIGGGCVDSGCDATDGTLIQTGTEQDVASGGASSYDAWYEIIPAPEIEVTSMTINPGDRMSASISQLATDVDVWTITLKDLTTGQSYTTTAPYPSTMDSAEWIEETPTEIGASGAGLASLPNLSSPDWTNTEINGGPANLKDSEQMDLTDSNGNIIGVPSDPGSDQNSFNECTWASVCTAP